jgi:hypothetical protein
MTTRKDVEVALWRIIHRVDYTAVAPFVDVLEQRIRAIIGEALERPRDVSLSVKDPAAQDLLWAYAQRRRTVDVRFADDLERALISAGYRPGGSL